MVGGTLTVGQRNVVERAAIERTVVGIALFVAVLPAAVMVVRAATSGWVPLFDAAYFTVRSRDVGTGVNPLVGAWSMGSREVGVWVNNVGPLQLDLLAPFTKLDPYWGTALGVAATNVSAVVGVWLVARRLFATVGVVAAMAATLVLQLNEGSLMLIEARQQLALVLPMWCLLWVAAAAWSGRTWALPWLVFVASFVVQTHFTYAYQAAIVAGGAIAACLLHHRRRLGDIARPLVIAAVIAVVCWAQPLWDQFAGTGNLANVIGQSGGSRRSVGVSGGLPILTESAFVPPFFTPGSMGDLLRRGERPTLTTSVLALATWAVALVAAAVVMRRHHRGLAAMSSVGLVALAASTLAVVKIPPTEQFGIIAQNYYWCWPIAVFAASAMAGTAMLHPYRRWRVVSGPTVAVWAGAALLLVTAITAVPLLSPTNRLPETAHEWSVSTNIARPLIDQLGDSLDELDVTAPVLVDLGAVRHVRYTLLAELQRHGIDFVFPAGSTDLARFGRSRCDDGSAALLLTLRSGDEVLQLDAGDTLIAAVPGLDDETSRRSTELATRFGDALRDGSVVVDVGAIRDLGGVVPAELDQVLTIDGMPARRLSSLLTDWRHFGAVEVDGRLVDDLADWARLERATLDDRMAISLRRLPSPRPDRCAELEPGDDVLIRASS